MKKFYLKCFIFIFLIALLALSACNKKPTGQKVVQEKTPVTKEVKISREETNINEEKTSEYLVQKINVDDLSFPEEDQKFKDNIFKPSEIFACLGVDDQLITDYRAGLFVAGSLPLVDLYDSSITSKIEFSKDGEYFDVIFNYYKDGDKLIAQYECPEAIKGNSFTDYFNKDEYRKKCIIEKKNNEYVSPDGCKPHLYCSRHNVKLKIFENFITQNTQDNKIIKIFEITETNPCQNARKLYDAAGQGNLNKVNEFIPKTDINIATSAETEPYVQWEDVMVLLLNRPLLKAIQSNHPEVVKTLLEQGADPNLSNIESDRTPFVREDTFDALGWAIKKNNNEIIGLISPKMRSKTGSLVVAACNGQNDLVEEILKEDTSTINKSDWINDTVHTPLSCALWGGSFDGNGYSPKHREVIKTLISYGVDINRPDPSGQDPAYCTPLQLAVLRKDLEIVKLLIDKGAEVNPKVRIITFYRKGAEITLGYCAALKTEMDSKMVKLLTEAGADKEEYNQIVFEQNIKGSYSKIAELIKAEKAKENTALLQKEHLKYTKPRWWVEDNNRNLYPFSELEKVIRDVEKSK